MALVIFWAILSLGNLLVGLSGTVIGLPDWTEDLAFANVGASFVLFFVALEDRNRSSRG